jgi:hypothetical protein
LPLSVLSHCRPRLPPGRTLFSADEIAILRKPDEWANGRSVIRLIIAFGVLR